MADDVATLGLEVESQSVKVAAEELRNFEAVARRTGETVDQVRDRFKKAREESERLAPATRAVGTESKKTGDEIQRLTGIAAGYNKALGDIRNQMISAAAGLGVLGAAMTVAGGPFLVAAIAIKAVVDVLKLVQATAEEAGRKAQELVHLSEATRLTVDQLRALKKIAGEFGVGGDQIESWLQRAAPTLERARDGTGELVDALNKIDPVFTRQIQQSTTMAERLDILSAAARRAKEQGQDVSLFWRDVFGRGSARADPVFTATALAGGIDKAGEAMKNFAGTTSAEIEERAKLTRQIEILNKQYEAMKEKLLGATSVLQLDLEAAKTRNSVMEKTLQMRSSFLGTQDQVIKAYSDEKVAINEVTAAEEARLAASSKIGGRRGRAANPALSPFANLVPPDEAGFQPPKPAGASGVDEVGFKSIGQSAGEAQLRINQAFNAMTKWMTVLGQAATIQEQTALAVAKTNKEFANNEHQLESGSEKIKERILASLKLNEATQLLGLRLSVLGQTAGAEEQMTQKLLERQKAQQQGAAFTDTEIANIDRVNKATANGTLTMQAATDATKLETQTLGMAAGAAATYRMEHEKINEAKRLGQPVSAETAAAWTKEAEAAGRAADTLERAKLAMDLKRERQFVFMSPEEVQIAERLKTIYPDIATALSSTEASQIRFTNALKEAKDVAGSFAKDFVRGMMDGKSFTDSLSSSLKSLSGRLADKAIENLLSDNFEQAAISAVSAVATFVGSRLTDNSEQKALEAARLKFSQMADQVNNFVMAADGFDLSPFVAAIQQIKSTALELIKAAIEAKDTAKAIQLIVSAVQQVNHQVDQFIKPKGNSVQEQIAQENENAQQLITELSNLNSEFHLGLDRTTEILAAAADHVAEIQRKAEEEIEKRRKTFQDRVFEATNDNTTLEGALAEQARRFQQERLDEEKAGNEASADLLLAQQAEELALRKSFNDKVAAETRRAEQERLDVITRATKGIVDYLNNLNVGSGTNLSPSLRLAAAQGAYNSTYGLALTGNVDALARITQDAENLRQAAQSFYGSGAGYQSILAAIKSQLTGLPAVQTSADPVVQGLLGVVTAVNNNATSTNTVTDTVRAAVVSDMQSTATKLDTSITKFSTMVDRLTDAVNALTNGTGWLSSINSLQDTSRAQLQLLNQQLTGSANIVTTYQTNSGTAVGYTGTINNPSNVNNNLLIALNKIVVNTWAIANNTAYYAGGVPVQAGTSKFGIYEKGGTLPAGGFGIMGEHSPLGPWIVRAGSQPVPITPSLPSLGGDTVGTLKLLLAEVHALRAERRQDAHNQHDATRDVARAVRDNTDDRAESSEKSRQQSRIAERRAA